MVFSGMKYADSRYTNEHAPFGQVSMQMAFSHDKMRTMTNSWGPGQLVAVGFSAGLDYAFMLAYTAALGFVALYRGKKSAKSVRAVGVLLVGTAFDAFESMLLFKVAENPVDFHRDLPAFIGIVAVLKFVCLGICVVYILLPN